MTVSYQYEVASSTSGGFTRLLFMWRGSLYKLIYRELLLFLLAFGVLSALYRNLFTVDQKRLFEKVVVYCDTFISLIPLSFVLGFYVAYVAGRWWNQYLAIPWPDKIMHLIALYVNGSDDHARMTRRALMRYLNLTLILVLRSISSAVKRRFPKLDHLVEAGFMTPTELRMYSSVPSVEFNTYWIPCTWFIHLLRETRRANRISDPLGLQIIMEEFNVYRSQCGMLWSYDWVSIPLVYTQVVTIATYSFFLAALVGRQYVDEDRKAFQMEIDIYLPVFTILQFFFYMGLLKVAEQLINPFGDDDEDFELNWLIDRHTKVSYLGVDTLVGTCPPLVKDMYFNEVDLTLPYTEAASAYKRKTYRGSVHNMVVPEEQHAMFLPEIEEENEESLPRTSILSLHKVGVQKQPEQEQQAAKGPTWQAAGSWRRSSLKGDAVDGRGPAGGQGGAADSGGSTVAPDWPASVDEADDVDAGLAGSRRVLRQDSLRSWKSLFRARASSGCSVPGELAPATSSSASPSPESEDEPVAGPRLRHSSGSSAGTASRPSPRPPRPPRWSAGPARLPGAACPLERRNSTPSPRAGRPRLQSCPKLLVLVARHDSTGRDRADKGKKGVRWKPVLDDAPRPVREDVLCRCCREHGPAAARRAVLAAPVRHLRRPTVRRRLGGAVAVSERPDLGSAPDLGLGASVAFVRDDSFWRGGKFPGTLACPGGRAGSRGILKRIMFWRGPDGPAEALGATGASSASAGNVMESVIVTVEPSQFSQAMPVSTSLPDIAAIRAARLPLPGLVVGAPDPPIRPSIPDTPLRPSIPDTPLRSSIPDTPLRPSIPDTPHRPSIPDTPLRPSIPDTPLRPSIPDTPHRPSIPDTPLRPSIPDTPLRPSVCETPLRSSVSAPVIVPENPLSSNAQALTIELEGGVGRAFHDDCCGQYLFPFALKAWGDRNDGVGYVKACPLLW